MHGSVIPTLRPSRTEPSYAFGRTALLPLLEPEDAFLVAEVAAPSIAFGRTAQRPLYAQAGIPECWIVSPRKPRIEVHRSLGENGYVETQPRDCGQSVSVQAFPALNSVVVDDLLVAPQ